MPRLRLRPGVAHVHVTAHWVDRLFIDLDAETVRNNDVVQPGASRDFEIHLWIHQEKIRGKNIGPHEGVLLAMIEASVVVGTETELPTILGFFDEPFPVNLFVAQLALGVVIPVVDGANEAVRLVLNTVARTVVLVDDNSLARLVAIDHDRVIKFFRVGPEDAVLVKGDGPRLDELVQKDGRLVQFAVPRGVLKNTDAPHLVEFLRPFDVVHEADHLDHPEPAKFVEAHDHRVHDRGFLGHQFKLVGLDDAHLINGIGARENGAVYFGEKKGVRDGRRVREGEDATCQEQTEIGA